MFCPLYLIIIELIDDENDVCVVVWFSIFIIIEKKQFLLTALIIVWNYPFYQFYPPLSSSIRVPSVQMCVHNSIQNGHTSSSLLLSRTMIIDHSSGWRSFGSSRKKLCLVFVCISSYNHNAIDQVNVIRTIYIWPIGHHIADFTYINIICDKLVFFISFHLFFLFNLIFLMMMNNNNI